VRRDLRCSNTLSIERAIEQNRGSEVFVQSVGRSHLTKLTTIPQKTEEYNQSLCQAFVDCERSFDSVEIWSVLESVQRCHIDWRYIQVMRCLSESATMPIPSTESANKTSTIASRSETSTPSTAIAIASSCFQYPTR
jgi:hypothetical protein